MDKQSSSIKAAHLVVDPPLEQPVSKQNLALVSFISPNDRVKQRLMYNFKSFLSHTINQTILERSLQVVLEVNQIIGQNLADYITKYKTSEDPNLRAVATILSKVKEKVKLDLDAIEANTVDNYTYQEEDLSDMFDIYVADHYQQLENEFSQKHGSQPSVHGFKIRGVFENAEQAGEYAKHLRDNVESHSSIFIAPVGQWVPWNPDPDAIQDQHYAVKELDELMAQYKENQQKAKQAFAERKKQMTENVEAQNHENLKKTLLKRLKEAPSSCS